MQDDLDRADNAFAAKVPTNICFQIDRLAMGPEKPGKRLQRQERLLFGTKKAQMEPEAMEPGGPIQPKQIQVMHGYDGILTDKVRVATTDELDRLLPAQNVDGVTLLQIAQQCEILSQYLVCRRIPAGID